jgi:hypothetical protein
MHMELLTTVTTSIILHSMVLVIFKMRIDVSYHQKSRIVSSALAISVLIISSFFFGLCLPFRDRWGYYAQLGHNEPEHQEGNDEDASGSANLFHS